MMNINEIIEDIVLLKLENIEPLKEIGITEKSIFAKILGYDDNGIWIHHPNFQIPENTSNSTKSIKPPSTRELEASILISWGFIISIVHFPNAKGLDFPNPLNKQIGFIPEEK